MAYSAYKAIKKHRDDKKTASDAQVSDLQYPPNPPVYQPPTSLQPQGQQSPNADSNCG